MRRGIGGGVAVDGRSARFVDMGGWRMIAFLSCCGHSIGVRTSHQIISSKRGQDNPEAGDLGYFSKFDSHSIAYIDRQNQRAALGGVFV